MNFTKIMITILFLPLTLKAAEIFPHRIFQDLVKQEMKKASIPGCALSYYDGTIWHDFTHGVAHKDFLYPITPTTRFQVASLTKAFVAYSFVRKLGAKGLESPAEQVNKVLNTQITLADILGQSSGLPRYFAEFRLEHAGPKLPFLKILKKHRPIPLHQTGKRYSYQNYLFSVLGDMSYELTGSSWQQLVKEQILQPLNMKSTFFGPFPDWMKEFLPQLNLAQPMGDHTAWSPYSQKVGPAGAIISNLVDMKKWVGHLLNMSTHSPDHPLFTTRLPSSRKEMAPMKKYRRSMFPKKRVQKIGYSLGLRIGKWHSTKWITHTGSVYGQRSLISFFPQENKALVLMTNGDSSIALGKIHNLWTNLISH